MHVPSGLRSARSDGGLAVLRSPFRETSHDWIAGIDQLQRYVAAAVCRDLRLHGPLPFQIRPEDAVQDILLELVQAAGQALLDETRKDDVVAAVKRVLRRSRDRKYQRRRVGLAEVQELQFDPTELRSVADAAKLATDLQADLGAALSEEEALIWHNLTAEGNKTVREVGAMLGIRHQRVSEVRRKLERLITSYFSSRE